MNEQLSNINGKIRIFNKTMGKASIGTFFTGRLLFVSYCPEKKVIVISNKKRDLVENCITNEHRSGYSALRFTLKSLNLPDTSILTVKSYEERILTLSVN